jgi:DNA-binding IclR family transcriptional regulator
LTITRIHNINLIGAGVAEMARGPVKSAVRAIEILKLFSEERRELSQKEIVERLRYPQSSATFLLKSMASLGYLSFNRANRTYFPTPEVYRIGNWLESFGYEQMFRRGVLATMLDELEARTGELISLTTQNDIYVQWHRMVGTGLPPSRRVFEGDVIPLTWSALGCMLLSRQSEVQIDRILRLINARESNPGNKIDVARMTLLLRDVRARSTFYMPNPRLKGAAAVAALLPVKIAGRMVAIGVGGDEERLKSGCEYIMSTLTETLAAYRDDLVSFYGEPLQL